MDLNLVTLILPIDSTLHLRRSASGTISNLVSWLGNLVRRDLRLALNLWIAPGFIRLVIFQIRISVQDLGLVGASLAFQIFGRHYGRADLLSRLEVLQSEKFVRLMRTLPVCRRVW